MTLSVTQTALVAAPAADVYDAATDAGSMTRAMRRHGPIPGVVGVQYLERGGVAPGATRRVTMTDGSVLTERIAAADRPILYRYDLVGGIAPPLSLLVRSGTSTWRFEEAGGATRVRWEYAFELTSPLAWPAAFLVLHLFFSGWMRRCLDAVREIAAGAPARRTTPRASS